MPVHSSDGPARLLRKDPEEAPSLPDLPQAYHDHTSHVLGGPALTEYYRAYVSMVLRSGSRSEGICSESGAENKKTGVAFLDHQCHRRTDDDPFPRGYPIRRRELPDQYDLHACP